MKKLPASPLSASEPAVLIVPNDPLPAGSTAAAVVEAEADSAPPAEIPGLVILDTPVERGRLVISRVIVRKPLSARELDGIALTDLLNLEYDAIEEALPRFTEPRLLKSDIAGLDPADLMKLTQALNKMFEAEGDADADEDEDEEEKVKNGLIELSRPLTIGEEEIASFTIRKPGAGEMRGLSLGRILKLDYRAVVTMLPRISSPRITKGLAAKMSAADFLSAGAEIVSFLLPKESTGSATA